MVKNILFDAFGTLFSLDIPNNDLTSLSPVQYTELIQLWRDKQLKRTWLLQAMDEYEDFDVVSKKSLQQSMLQLGITDPAIPEILLPIYQNPKVYDDVISGLQSLRSLEVKNFILSNGTPEMLQIGIENSGLSNVLNGFISVDEIRQFKPSPQVYRYALKKINSQFNDTLFLSSNQWDIAGGLNAGLRAVWLNRDQTFFESFGQDPYAVITSLGQLEELIQSYFQRQ